jgi:hypothetical protein
MKKTLLIVLLIISASTLSFAESKWAFGVLGNSAIARLDLENNIQLNFGFSSTFQDTDNNTSTMMTNLLVLNKITTNTYWKIGGGLALLSGKSFGETYGGSEVSLVVGVEYRVSERFVLDFQIKPVSFVSNSVGSTNSSSSTLLQGAVGATITL